MAEETRNRAEPPEDVRRWTAKRRAALALNILRGAPSGQEAARKHGLTVADIESWRDTFLLAAENPLHDITLTLERAVKSD